VPIGGSRQIRTFVAVDPNDGVGVDFRRKLVGTFLPFRNDMSNVRYCQKPTFIRSLTSIAY